MGPYSVRFGTRLDLPDDRLTLVGWSADLLTWDFRQDHVSPYFVRDIEEYMRHISRGGLLRMTPERAAEPSDWDYWYERVDPEHMPLRTFGVARGRNSTGREYYRFLVRADMMSKEALDEFNFWVPTFQGLIRYAHSETTAPAEQGGTAMLERLGAPDLAMARCHNVTERSTSDGRSHGSACARLMVAP